MLDLFRKEPLGRKFYPKRDVKGFLFVVAAEDNKQVPSQLSGNYTRPQEAQKAIDRYMEEYEVSEEQVQKYRKRQELELKRKQLENAASS